MSFSDHVLWCLVVCSVRKDGDGWELLPVASWLPSNGEGVMANPPRPRPVSAAARYPATLETRELRSSLAPVEVVRLGVWDMPHPPLYEF